MAIMLHMELTEKILAACFEVSNELGAGFLESVYQNALMIAIQQKGLTVDCNYPIPVSFRGVVVGNFYADIVVDSKVIVELKAIEYLTPVHQAQVINYLKATGFDVGLLVNFGRPKLEFKRLHREAASTSKIRK